MAKSLLHKASLLFLFLLPGEFFRPDEAQQPGCEAINIKIETINTTASVPSGSVEAIVTGAESPVFYFFFREAERQMLSINHALSKLDHIAPGTYQCLIVDNKGCSKKTEFKIE